MVGNLQSDSCAKMDDHMAGEPSKGTDKKVGECRKAEAEESKFYRKHKSIR